MVVNLYRGGQYVQVWSRGSTLVIHRGVLGQRGSVSNTQIHEGMSVDAAIQQAVQDAQGAGFHVLNREQQTQVLVNFSISTLDPNEIPAFVSTVQTILTELLGWTGNGYCEGHSLGREGITMWCLVVDVALAVASLIAGLEQHGLLRDKDEGPARLAVPAGDRYNIVFPEEMRGERLI